MNLARQQDTFMAGLMSAADDLVCAGVRETAPGGFAVYRNNYRQSLLDAMRTTFARTAQWVGDDAFSAAAVHHLVLHPPTHWTLDRVGAGFPETASGLFRNDPDVGDLAALEWAMQEVFVAPDDIAMDVAAFRRMTAGFGEGDWAAMPLPPCRSVRLVEVATDCVSLWRALSAGACPPDPPRLQHAHVAIVWRRAWRPVCRLATKEEGASLRCLASGGVYADVCARLARRRSAGQAAHMAGGMLAQWLEEGLLAWAGPDR